MQTFVSCLRDALVELEQHESDTEYRKAVAAYLGLWVSRSAMFITNVGIWKTSGEFFSTPFAMQAIPMVWDYPEVNLINEATSPKISEIIPQYRRKMLRLSGLQEECDMKAFT
jgi:adenine-specific DNA methylase